MPLLVLNPIRVFFFHPSQKRVLALALPMVFSSISTPLLGVVDTSIIGHLGQVYFLSGITIGANILSFLFFLLVFLRMSTVGITGQSFGAKNAQKQVVIFVQGLILALTISISLLIFHPWIIDLGLYFMNGSSESLYEASHYVTIRIFSAPATLLNYVIIGWFIGRQNTKLPMMMILTTNILNIIFDLIFVIGFNLKVSGVAWASVISEYSALLLALFYLKSYWKQQGLPAINLKKIYLEKAQFKDYFKLSSDIFWRSLCLQFVLIFFTSQASHFGDSILAANNLLLSLLMLLAYLVDGFASASESISSQRLGEKNKEMFKTELSLIFIWSLLLACLLIVMFIFFNSAIFSLFTNIQLVITNARIYLPWLLLIAPIAAWSYFLDGVFIGIAQAKSMRDTMFIAVSGYLLIWSVTLDLENHGLWLSFFFFMLLRSFSLSYRLRRLWVDNTLFQK